MTFPLRFHLLVDVEECSKKAVKPSSPMSVHGKKFHNTYMCHDVQILSAEKRKEKTNMISDFFRSFLLISLLATFGVLKEKGGERSEG